MTPAEKAALKARMLAQGLDDIDVFLGVLGNRNNVTLTKPLRRRASVGKSVAKANS